MPIIAVLLMLRLLAALGIAMTRPTVAASIVMFSVPFLLLGVCFAALPKELTVLRNPVAGAALLAPKSLFTVFRVPLMNLTHGAIAAVMLSRKADFSDVPRRASYSRAFLTLLFAIALKSNFEALEMTGLARSHRLVALWLMRGTLISVVGGVGLAFLYARGVPLPWPELCLTKLRKAALTFFVAVYLGIVAATLLVSHRS